MYRRPSMRRIASRIATILLALYATNVLATVPASERAVLIDLYTSTDGDGWLRRTNWNGIPGTECTWYGITCDSGGTTVTGIDLTFDSFHSLPLGLNLVGPLPALTGLTNLQSFNVSYNQLTGTIPA